MLVCIGVVMVYSASSASALLSDENPSTLLLRQGIYAVLGFILFAVCARVGVGNLVALGRPAVLVCAGLLVAVLVPGIGIMANGSRRWLGMGNIQVQPAELAKIALIIWLAGYLVRNRDRLDTLRDLRMPLMIVGGMGVLIVVEPDLGTAVVLVGVGMIMLAVAGVPGRLFGLIAAVGAAAVALFIAIEPYRMARITSFLDPWSDPEGAGFQIVQAQLAIGSGGLSGVGLGNGLQKVNYLPEAHTDMILATVGEELGLIGVFCVIALIGAVVGSGYRIALSAPDSRQRLLASGLTSLIGLQALVNLGAVLGVLPVTGVPLPFVSYGGSSLVVLAAASGILVGIGRRSRVRRLRVVGDDTPARGDRRGRDRRAHHAGARAS